MVVVVVLLDTSPVRVCPWAFRRVGGGVSYGPRSRCMEYLWTTTVLWRRSGGEGLSGLAAGVESWEPGSRSLTPTTQDESGTHTPGPDRTRGEGTGVGTPLGLWGFTRV